MIAIVIGFVVRVFVSGCAALAGGPVLMAVALTLTGVCPPFWPCAALVALAAIYSTNHPPEATT